MQHAKKRRRNLANALTPQFPFEFTTENIYEQTESSSRIPKANLHKITSLIDRDIKFA